MVVAAHAGGAFRFSRAQSSGGTTHVSEAITKGDLIVAVTVSATGTVQPTTGIAVFSELSVTPATGKADYNDRVGIGQVKVGYTATATIMVAEEKRQFFVPNAALPYAPPPAAAEGSGGSGLIALIKPRPPAERGGNAFSKAVWVPLGEVPTEVAVIPGATGGWQTVIAAGDLAMATASSPAGAAPHNDRAADGVEGDRTGDNLCIIGETLRTALFGATDPTGERIGPKAISREVIGLLVATGAGAFGQDQDDIVIMPVHTVQRRLPDSQDVSTIMKQVAPVVSPERAIGDIQALLRERQGISLGRMTLSSSWA